MYNIKVPYGLIACTQPGMSREESSIICAIDALVQRVRKAQLSGSNLDIPKFVQAHVENAEKYYSDFSAEDMMTLDLLPLMAAAVMDNLKED